nr:hypothetical protein [Propionicimonas sp.]
MDYEAKVYRIEVSEHVSGKSEDELRWVVRYQVADEPSEPRAIMVLYGTLARARSNSWAQVAVMGQIAVDRKVWTEAGPEGVVTKYGYGVMESMYDTGRRAINANAALMDLDFELPFLSPVTVIRPFEARPVSKTGQ